MRTMLFLAALAFAGCTNGDEVKDDDTDTEAGETDTDVDTPDDSGLDTDSIDPTRLYMIIGYIGSVPYGTDSPGRPPWTILLNPVNGSLVVPDSGRTYIQCLTWECGDLRPITRAEFLCRIGDQTDIFAREICRLLVP